MGINIPCYSFFTELKQNILQFIWKYKRPQIAKAILKQKNGARGIRLPTSVYTTKLQSSKQYDTGTKTEIQINGTEYTEYTILIMIRMLIRH